MAGLLADAQNKMWPEMVELLPHVTHIEFLSAICITCGTPDANYSVKLEPGITEKDQSAAPARRTEDIGGSEKYAAVPSAALVRQKEQREDIGGSEKYASVCLSCRDGPIDPRNLEKRKEIVQNINKLKHSF